MQAVDVCAPAKSIRKTNVITCTAIAVLGFGVAGRVEGLIDWFSVGGRVVAFCVS